MAPNPLRGRRTQALGALSSIPTTFGSRVAAAVPCAQDGFYDDGSWHAQAFGRLSGDLGDEVEVLIEVQHREPGEFGRCGDDQIGD